MSTIIEANKSFSSHLSKSQITPDFKRCIYTTSARQAKKNLMDYVRIDIYISMQKAKYVVTTYEPESNMVDTNRYYPILKAKKAIDRLSFYIDIGEILDTLHAQNIVHNDFKPANMVVDENGRPQLIDFGGSSKVDDLSFVAGTLLYADRVKFESLALRQSEPSSPAADIYAFALSLFEMEIVRLGERQTIFQDLISKQRYAVAIAKKLNNVKMQSVNRLSKNQEELHSHNLEDTEKDYNEAISDYFKTKKELVLQSNWELLSQFATFFYPPNFLAEDTKELISNTEVVSYSAPVDKKLANDLLSKTYSCSEFFGKIGERARKELLDFKASSVITFNSFMEKIMTESRELRRAEFAGKLARHLRRFYYFHCLIANPVLRI